MLLGCIFGGITGLVVGVTNGVLSGLITRWFFTPPFSSTRYALTLAGVSGVGSVLGCWLVVSPFINMLSMDRASYRGLFSLNPMLLIIVIPVAIWESQNFARWYEWQLPS